MKRAGRNRQIARGHIFRELTKSPIAFQPDIVQLLQFDGHF